jgi:hypothetical protein
LDGNIFKLLNVGLGDRNGCTGFGRYGFYGWGITFKECAYAARGSKERKN